MIERTCETCETLFKIFPYQSETAKYCSNKCKNIGLSVRYKRRKIKPPDQTGKRWSLSEKTRMKMSDYAKSIDRKPPSRKNSLHSEKTKERLRALRLKQIFPKKDTVIEVAMQKELKKRGINFEKHFPVLNRYQVDIFIHPNIIIECDGDYWHSLSGRREWDEKRDIFLSENGFNIFHFNEFEIKKDVSKCMEKIMENWDTRIGEDPL